MLLKELAGYRSSSKTIKDILGELVRKNRISVDAGAMSLVIQPKGKPYVYRVWYKDPGYDLFLKYVANNKSNKHLVKVLSKVRTVKVKFPNSSISSVNILKLEKLEPLASNEQRMVATLADSISASHGSFETTDLNGVSMFGDGFIDTVVDLYYYEMDLGHGTRFDFHADNVMKRGEDFVVIDPFSGNITLSIVSDSDLFDYQ